MTPQEQRNKRFDEKFYEKNKIPHYWFGENIPEALKNFLTSEVNLTIEQVEKWTSLFGGSTVRIDDLLTFLKELKK